jgi:hypothetical protein
VKVSFCQFLDFRNQKSHAIAITNGSEFVLVRVPRRRNSANYFFSSHDTIDFHACISAGHKITAFSPHDSVCLELPVLLKQDNVTSPRRLPNRLHMQDVAILNRRPHAPAPCTKAESLPARDQFARQHCEKGGLLPRFSHES